MRPRPLAFAHLVKNSNGPLLCLGTSSPRPPGCNAVGTSVLELTSIRKRFGGVIALDDASLQVRAGTVHALLGENGAGKTTLMRVAFGMVRPDNGSIVLRGRSCRFASPNDAL